MDKGQTTLRDHLHIDFRSKEDFKSTNSKAKNAILVVGSGMSITTLRAAATVQEQKNGKKISYEHLPIVGFANVKYCDFLRSYEILSE